MKRYYLIIAIGVAVMISGLIFGPKRLRGQAIPPGDAPNRAVHARVKASGSRTARAGEIARSSNTVANATLIVPQTFPRWVPEYAIDGSPLTRWAADKGGGPWLEIEIGNKIMPAAPVSSLAVSWADSRAGKWRVMSSNDGQYWKEAAVKEGSGGIETINFDPPLSARSIRIESADPKAQGMSIVDVGIFGSSAEAAPGAVKGLAAKAKGADRIDLSWDGPGDDPVYLYRIYRGQGKPPEINSDHMIEAVADTSFIDLGLKPGIVHHYAVVAESFGGKTSETAARAEAKTEDGKTFARFKYRGVIEGFYNDPWPHQERLRMISFMEDAGFNYYIYAPKLDPLHRQWWRRPYPAAELKNFAELLAFCRAHGIAFNYGISPGLDMDLGKEAEVAKLEKKLKSLFEVGVRNFTLCLDDIPESRQADRKIAERQVKVVNGIHSYLVSLDPDCRLFFVPTVYSRTYSRLKNKKPKKAGYLEAIAALHPEIGIMWTGPGEVFSRKIDKAGAMELKNLWGRPVIVWDNYPVNDVALRHNVFTGPYLGRDLALGEAVDGVFLNPMYLPAASKIALYTAGEYMTAPEYDPNASYQRALRFLGKSDKGTAALATVSDCLTPHPVFPDLGLEETPVFIAMEDYWSTRENQTLNKKAADKLKEMFADCASNPRDLEAHLEDPSLKRDLMPVSQKLSLFGKAGLKALELMTETDQANRAVLRNEVLSLQAEANAVAWKVLDESASLPLAFIGFKVGKRNAFNDFINRALAIAP